MLIKQFACACIHPPAGKQHQAPVPPAPLTHTHPHVGKGGGQPGRQCACQLISMQLQFLHRPALRLFLPRPSAIAPASSPRFRNAPSQFIGAEI